MRRLFIPRRRTCSSACAGTYPLCPCFVVLTPTSVLTTNVPVLARLKAEMVLLTSALRQADLTVAVPLSASRLDRLEALCRHWGGPVSAAVYVALVPRAAGPVLDVTRRAVQALFDRCLSDDS